jgi:hypothetical protein
VVQLRQHKLGRGADLEGLPIPAQLAQLFALKKEIGAIARCRRADLNRSLVGIAAVKHP